MKKLILLLFGATFISACWEEYDYSKYDPEIMSRTEFENSVSIIGSKPMEKAGKIYLVEDMLFLGDENKGFHIYDNSDPTAPKSIGFLRIPGASDLAVKENSEVIYVNQAVDLIAFSIDKTSLQITMHKRLKDVFPVLRSPDGYYPAENFTKDKIVVDWHKK
ncbi:MAG: hypothetical protein Q3983_01850 [Capnocytophaga sp.]|nr:hypothetical protein [Capnocytophaga sp.]